MSHRTGATIEDTGYDAGVYVMNFFDIKRSLEDEGWMGLAFGVFMTLTVFAIVFFAISAPIDWAFAKTHEFDGEIVYLSHTPSTLQTTTSVGIGSNGGTVVTPITTGKSERNVMVIKSQDRTIEHNTSLAALVSAEVGDKVTVECRHSKMYGFKVRKVWKR